MRVTNDPGGPGGPSGAFAELFRLQSDFQARLAEETLRYLRRLQGAVVPAAPGTVVMPTEGLELRAEGTPGGNAQLAVEVENLQRVHCMVTPQLTPLISADGVTWFPASDSPTSSKLVPPNATERLALSLSVPVELPPGEYRGALLLQGFRRNSIAVVVAVSGQEPTKPARAARREKSADATSSSKSTTSGAPDSTSTKERESPGRPRSAKKPAKKAAKKGSRKPRGGGSSS